MKHPSYSDLSVQGWRTVVCPTCSSTSAIASPVRPRTLVGNKARIIAKRKEEAALVSLDDWLNDRYANAPAEMPVYMPAPPLYIGWKPDA